LTDVGAIDVERASYGVFSSDPQAAFERWAELREWSTTVSDVAIPYGSNNSDLPFRTRGRSSASA